MSNTSAKKGDREMKKIGLLALICMFTLLMSGCAKAQNDMPESSKQDKELSIGIEDEGDKQQIEYAEIDQEKQDDPEEENIENIEAVENLEVEANEQTGSELAAPTKEDVLDEQNEYTIEGFAFVDGMEKPVCVTLGVESIHRGEEAYEKLQAYNSGITPPNENEEYIIATFNVSYDSGEIEELYMMENRASLEQAGLYFALSNGQSNAYDVTSYLSNSIYDILLTKGQSVQGAVAFLQEKGNTEPLVFVGFEEMVRFDIN